MGTGTPGARTKITRHTSCATAAGYEGESGYPVASAACLGAGQGQGSMWSTRRLNDMARSSRACVGGGYPGGLLARRGHALYGDCSVFVDVARLEALAKALDGAAIDACGEMGR